MTLPLKLMAFDTYGLSEEQYLEYFGQQASLILRAIKKLREAALDEQINLDSLGSKFTWDLLQEAAYGADDVCRVHQKEKDPDELKRRTFDYISTPSREEMMEEIMSIQAKIESLTDYVGNLTTAVSTGLTSLVD